MHAVRRLAESDALLDFGMLRGSAGQRWAPDWRRVFADRANKTKSAARHGPYESLLGTGVADRPPGGTHSAGERVVRHEPSIPDGTDEFVLAHDAVSMSHQVDQHVEYLWLDMNDVAFSTELTPVYLDFAVCE